MILNHYSLYQIFKQTQCVVSFEQDSVHLNACYKKQLFSIPIHMPVEDIMLGITRTLGPLDQQLYQSFCQVIVEKSFVHPWPSVTIREIPGESPIFTSKYTLGDASGVKMVLAYRPKKDKSYLVVLAKGGDKFKLEADSVHSIQTKVRTTVRHLLNSTPSQVTP